MDTGFLGLVIIVGVNIAVSWLLGYVVAFGIIRPILVAKGAADGAAYSAEYPDLLTYMSLESPDPVHIQSPRYWLLWPAILVMVTASVTDLACRWKLFARSLHTTGLSAMGLARRLRAKHTKSTNQDDLQEGDDTPTGISRAR